MSSRRILGSIGTGGGGRRRGWRKTPRGRSPSPWRKILSPLDIFLSQLFCLLKGTDFLAGRVEGEKASTKLVGEHAENKSILVAAGSCFSFRGKVRLCRLRISRTVFLVSKSRRRRRTNDHGCEGRPTFGLYKEIRLSCVRMQ